VGQGDQRINGSRILLTPRHHTAGRRRQLTEPLRVHVLLESLVQQSRGCRVANGAGRHLGNQVPGETEELWPVESAQIPASPPGLDGTETQWRARRDALGGGPGSGQLLRDSFGRH
jgi:hypothetical protein